MRSTLTTTRFLFGLATAGALLAACGSSNSTKTSAAVPAPPRPSVATTPAPAPAAAAGASVSVKSATSPLGQILVGPDGRTLYAFTNDTDAKSTCTGTCAEAWPPAVVASSWTVAPGLDSGIFSTVRRDDGTEQLTAGRFPLYYFSGDARPGDVNGQGSGNVWFVVDTKAEPVKDAGAAAGAAATRSSAPAPAAPATVASLADSPLGKIVVDGSGRTLYAFTKDTNGASTCLDACANAWPPALVTGDVAVQGLDQSQFTTVDRPDGAKQ